MDLGLNGRRALVTGASKGIVLEAGSGCIVTTSSVNVFLPDPAVIDYCAAKATLTNVCKALSKEVGPAGIRVNTVSPGPVSTGLWLGEHGVAQTIAQSQGASPDDIARQAAGDRRRDASRRPRRSPISSSCSPASGPRTSPAPTSSSTAASSRRSEG